MERKQDYCTVDLGCGAPPVLGEEGRNDWLYISLFDDPKLFLDLKLSICSRIEISLQHRLWASWVYSDGNFTQLSG